MTKKVPYTEDLSHDLYDPLAPALFTPSVSSNYVGYVSSYGDRMPKHRAPKGLTKEGTELQFLNENSGSWHYNAALTSAGHASLDLTKIDTDPNYETFFRKRDKSKTLIIGDSGGYQIGTGVLKFDWKNFESDANNKLRLEILRWMESIADLSMTLDVPVWGIDAGLEGITTFDECLKKTLWNHNFFIKNRVPGATRLMNILHGRTDDERDLWWDAVKDLPFEGWAFAGSNVTNFETILRRLIIMRDGGYLDESRNWIHFLGVSKLSSACAFTAIQQAIRKYVEPKFTISFDASSPFLSTAMGALYTGANFNPNKLSFAIGNIIDNKVLAGSQEPFPFLSPLGKKLTLGDFCVKGTSPTNVIRLLGEVGFDEASIADVVKKLASGEFTKDDTKDIASALAECEVSKETITEVSKSINDVISRSSWDTWSYMMTMNHNCYIHTRGVKEVNHLFNLPRPQIANFIPEELIEFKELVNEIFTSSDPLTLIKKHGKMLRNLSGSRNNDKKTDVFKSSGLFELESDTPSLDIDNDGDEHIFDDSILADLE